MGSAFDKKPGSLMGERPINRRPQQRQGVLSRIHLPALGFNGMPLSRRAKQGIAVGALSLWSALSYDSIPGKHPIPVTPTQTVSNILRIPDRFFNNKEYNHTTTKKAVASTETVPSTTAAVANTQTSVVTNQTLPTFGHVTPAVPVETTTLATLAPIIASTEAATTIAPLVVLPPTSATQASEVLPNPMQYSAAAGSVVCSGEIQTVTIDPNNGPSLRQLQDQTGQPWTASAIRGRNPLDEQLYNEVLATSGYTQQPAGAFTVHVRNNCIGLER